MVSANLAEHHLHTRKKVHQNLEEYPHNDKWKNKLDTLIYLIAISEPIMTLPQAYTIWIRQSAEGVSLISWSWYLITAFIWLAYGIIHKEKPLILSNSFWIVINLIIVIEILAFG